ncbi:VWA domain-containing protein [Halorubrum sp. DTA46]|uniref:VWA domain-containing protein n=1 Tax=Halorubrum sp. DTA46 TaxID=3402162 RepID=UPI003AAB75DA
MTEKQTQSIGLSRRKVLAGLGAVGVASAGAGLGTTAYFSDQESFDGNAITAGELDLKLDYRATYNGGPGRLDEIQEYYPEFDVVEEADGVYLLGEVPASDSDAWEDVVREADFCHGSIAEELINGDEIPVFTLDDVKPGDYGEVTISLHICDNPAWMWMRGELTENAQNGYTDPEHRALDEGDFDHDDTPFGGQLADAIETRLWYDENCNNIYEGSGETGEVDVAVVMDVSGSMNNIFTPAKNGAKTLVNELADSDQGALVSYQTGATREFDLTAMDAQGKGNLETAIDGLNPGGFTNIQGGVIYAAEELLGDEDFSNDELGIDLTTNPSGNDRAGADKVMVFLTDGQANRRYNPNGSVTSSGNHNQAAIDAAQAAKDAGIRVFTIAYGTGADLQLMQNMASSPDDAYDAGDINAIQQVFGQIAGSITGEEEIFRGSLAELMSVLDGGMLLDGNRATEETVPYAGALTQCLGFEWWLPTDVGNEVQTDSVGFDIGFYAEQSRHNADPENPFVENSTA